MRAGRAIAMVFVWGAAALGAADPPIEFSGVLTADGKTRIALTDKANKVTRWIEPGEAFLGYSVVRYDPEGGAIFLRKDGQEHRLSLVAARFADSSTTPASPASAAQAAPPDAVATNRIRSNLRQFFAAARQVQTERGLSQVTYADVVGPGKPIRELTPVAGEDYTGLSYSPNTSLITVTTSSGTLVALNPNPAPSPANIAGAPPPLPSNPAPTASPPSDAGSVATPGAPVPNIAASTPVTPPVAPSATAPAIPTPEPTAPGTPASPPAGTVAGTPASAPNSALSPSAGDAAGSVPGPGSATDGLQPTGRATTTSTYTIQANDTLDQISTRTGVPIERLRELNPTVLQGSSLPGGQTIRTQ